MEGYPEITKDNWNGGVQVEELPNAGKYTANMKWPKPLPMPAINNYCRKGSKGICIGKCRCYIPKRDAVDTRIQNRCEQVKSAYHRRCKIARQHNSNTAVLPIDTYKIGIITDVSQVGGYPEYKGTPYKDSDNDGMPDDWETKNGLNPRMRHDACSNTDKVQNGYTNIEIFLNSVVPVKM